MKNQRAEIYLLNPDCKNPQIPAYNHLKIGNEIYLIKNVNKIHLTKNPSLDLKSTYLTCDVIISGTVNKEKGNFPNPMTEFDVVELESLEQLLVSSRSNQILEINLT